MVPVVPGTLARDQELPQPASFTIRAPDPRELRALIRGISAETGERHGFLVRRLLRQEAKRLGVSPVRRAS